MGLHALELSKVAEYDTYGYGNYTYGGALKVDPRYDIMPASFASSTRTKVKDLSRFLPLPTYTSPIKNPPIS